MSYGMYFALGAMIIIAPHAPRRPALVAAWLALFLSLGCNLGWWLK